MRFPNAARGVKKLFTAEILQLIGTLAMVVALAMLIVTASAAGANAEGGFIAAGLGTIVLTIGSSVLLLIANILALVGVINASRDDGAFKTALFAIIISFVAAIVMGIFSSSAIVTGICQSIQNLMGIFVTIFVIQGIINLANQLGDSEVAQKGKNILTIIIIVYALAIVANIIAICFGGTFVSVTAAILAIVALALDAIGYIMYLVFLNKGKKMLAE